MKRPKALLALIPLALAGGCLLPAFAAAGSHNWSGYIAPSNSSGGYSAASASWTIPQVAKSASETGDATWVGIGGASSSDLIQTGTRAIASSGAVSYEAWYELLPAPAVPIDLTIAAGDQVRASVREEASGKWQIVFDDLSSGGHFSTVVSYASTGSSAEWIEEAPQIGGKAVALDDFSSLAFSDVSATTQEGKETLAALSANRVSLVAENGGLLAAASALSPAGDSFTISRR